jgi:hypothetical protein
MNSSLCWRGATDAYLPSKASFSFQSAGLGPSQIRISAVEELGLLERFALHLALDGDDRASARDPLDQEVSRRCKSFFWSLKIWLMRIRPGMSLDISLLGLLSSTPRDEQFAEFGGVDLAQHGDAQMRLAPGTANA